MHDAVECQRGSLVKELAEQVGGPAGREGGLVLGEVARSRSVIDGSRSAGGAEEHCSALHGDDVPMLEWGPGEGAGRR